MRLPVRRTSSAVRPVHWQSIDSSRNFADKKTDKLRWRRKHASVKPAVGATAYPFFCCELQRLPRGPRLVCCDSLHSVTKLTDWRVFLWHIYTHVHDCGLSESQALRLERLNLRIVVGPLDCQTGGSFP